MYTRTPALNTPLPPNPLPPLSFFCDFHFYPSHFPIKPHRFPGITATVFHLLTQNTEDAIGHRSKNSRYTNSR